MMKKTPVFELAALLAAASIFLSSCGTETETVQTDTAVSSVYDTTEAKSLSESSAVEQSEPTQTEVPLKEKSTEEIVASLSLEQKAAQMVQGAIYNVSDAQMSKYDYGSILSTYGEYMLSSTSWLEVIRSYQRSAVASESGIPFLFGQDSVHGVNYCLGTVIFPHNIGIGAADDEELTYQMGLAVADEIKLTGMLWNFAPCVAQSQDPRWGRTYESYSSDTELTAKLAVAYSKGLVEGGTLPCAKHFFADGNAVYGTGEKSDVQRIIDRGDAQLDEAQISDLLSVYQRLIDAGVRSVMISHSSLNGVKMHENEKYISYLKNEMGFDGIVVSDWNSIHNITGTDLREKAVKAVNCGIDMLMEPDNYKECSEYIIEAVNSGEISLERIDDAVTRIISVKKDLGLFDDPMMENLTTKQSKTGSEEYRELARTLAEESLVLLKNENSALPLKDGAKIYVTGPAADDTGVQCGGWTLIWDGRTDERNGKKWIADGKTILDGFNQLAEEHGYTIITDKKYAAEADVTVLCLGEQPYAEWNGDSPDISITGELGLDGNKAAIEEAEKLGKPTVACIVSGRNVILSEYEDKWDSIVMCYLPGSEGDAVANVLSGDKGFKGKLPMPYYASVDDIATGSSKYPVGYGLEANG